MNRIRRGLGRVGGFGSTVVATGITSLLVIPAIVRFGGEDGWSSVAVGQGIGTILGIISGLGWAQTGPTDVARASTDERGEQFRDSIVLRLASLALTLPAAIGASALLRPSDGAITAWAAAANILAGCGAAWFFIGCGQPRQLMLLDTLPRVTGIALGAVGTALVGSALAAAIGMVGGSLLAIGASSVVITRQYGPGRRRSPRELWGILRGQVDGIGIAVFSASYLFLPLLFLSATHPAATATYALADRLKQQAMSASTPVAQTLQGWVPTAAGEDLYTRVRLIARVATALASIGGLVFVIAAPHLGALLGAGKVTVHFDISLPLGLAFGLNIWTLIVGSSCLLPLGRSRSVFLSAVAGAVIIVPALVILSVAYSGAAGVAWAVTAAQATVACVQMTALISALRRQSSGP